MNSRLNKCQSGFALLLFVLVLITIGGVVLIGITQQTLNDVEQIRAKKNKDLLLRAKEALLVYAYRYPSINNRGPGRLPCPDTDNDGIANNTCFNNNAVVGRLPWRNLDLGFYDAADTSNERLWYAVSSAFDYGPGNTIDYETLGTISIFDQTGSLIYDGATNGIVAVIIAPGPAIAGQDRNVTPPNADDRTDLIADTDPGIIDPVNYLDSFGGFDNSAFVNGSIAVADGFILGPVVDNVTNSVVINDQIIVITADEIIKLAEKATLETYRETINEYLARPGFSHPWLNDYSDISDLNIYDTNPGSTAGRIPFINHYEDRDTHTIITDLQIDYDIDWDTFTDAAHINNPAYIDAFRNQFFGGNFNGSLDILRSNLSYRKAIFDGSINSIADNIGTLVSRADGTTTIDAGPGIVERTLYFWDGCASCPMPEDGWEFCDVDIGDETDCARNASGTSFEEFNDWDDHADTRIRRVTLRLWMDAEFLAEFNYAISPTLAYTPPTAANNARIVATHNPASVTTIGLANTTYTDATNLIDIEVIICEQDNFVGDVYNVHSEGNDDSYSELCTPDLISTLTVNQFDVETDYFPELPYWVEENNWNNSIMMAFAEEFKPGGAQACTPGTGSSSSDCLVVRNLNGTNNDIVSLLVIAGETDLIDGDDLNGDGDYSDSNEEPPDGDLSNDMHDIFETENYSGIGPYPNLNNDPDPASDTGESLVFDRREDVVPGNSADSLLIINRN